MQIKMVSFAHYTCNVASNAFSKYETHSSREYGVSSVDWVIVKAEIIRFLSSNINKHMLD